jgi:release factor H-coupled RctB family protein
MRTSGGCRHRKGATSADRGLVVIPGSRGDFSYVVEPVLQRPEEALFSLSHDAGRKWSRNDAHARLSRRYSLAYILCAEIFVSMDRLFQKGCAA